MSEHEECGLVYPFVVCTSKGGPYEDEAFVAGVYFGQIMAECKTITKGREKQWTVPSALVPQVDLLAMHEGLTVTAEPWDEYPDAWTSVVLSRPLG